MAQKQPTQPGHRLTRTLDADLPRFAVATLQRQLRGIARQSSDDGAALVLYNAAGKLLAWVGSS